MKSGLGLQPRAQRSSREPVVPMINVVFLLLIFFLMTAQIVPPAPFDLTLPEAGGDEDQGAAELYISADGEVAFETLRGDAALALAATRANEAPLRVHADATLSAAALATILRQLAEQGATQVELVTEGG